MEVLWYGERFAEENERTRKERREKMEDGRYGRLVGRQEEVFEIEARPADRTCVSRKNDRSPLDAPADPVEKLFFLTFDQHRGTSDAKSAGDRLMRLQFACKPISPLRHSGDSVNMGDGGPDESVFRACQQSSSRTRRYVARSELFGQSDYVTQGLLAPGKLHRAFEALCVSF